MRCALGCSAGLSSQTGNRRNTAEKRSHPDRKPQGALRKKRYLSGGKRPTASSTYSLGSACENRNGVRCTTTVCLLSQTELFPGLSPERGVVVIVVVAVVIGVVVLVVVGGGSAASYCCCWCCCCWVRCRPVTRLCHALVSVTRCTVL